MAPAEVDAPGAALRRDHPAVRGGSGGPEDLRALTAWLAEHGAPPGLDVVVDGETPAEDAAAAAAHAGTLADAGATWWLETRWGMPDTMPERVQDMTERLAAGRGSGPSGRKLVG